MAKLSAKQEQFCLEYLIDLNATQAAIRAGYSEKSAKEISYELLTKLHINQRVQALMDERSARVIITADWVLNGIKELTEERRESDDIKAAYKGYELAGKHMKMFTDKSEHEIKGAITTQINHSIID